MDYSDLGFDLDPELEGSMIDLKDIPFSSTTFQESAKEAAEHRANTGKIAPSTVSLALVHSLPAKDLRPFQDEDVTGLETLCQPRLKCPKIEFHGSPLPSALEWMRRELPGLKHKEALETSKQMLLDYKGKNGSLLKQDETWRQTCEDVDPYLKKTENLSDANAFDKRLSNREGKNESLLKQDETLRQACEDAELYLEKIKKLSDANALLRSGLEEIDKQALNQEEKEKAYDFFDKRIYARLMASKNKFNMLKHGNKSPKCAELEERLVKIEAGAVNE